MPHVQVTLLEGRTPEQKRKVAEGITRILVEEAGARISSARAQRSPSVACGG